MESSGGRRNLLLPPIGMFGNGIPEKKGTAMVTTAGITKEAMDDIDAIMNATDALSLFGANRKRAKLRYRRLIRSVHPDANGDAPQAAEATKRLNSLWEAYKGDKDTASDDTKTSEPNAAARKRRPAEVTRNTSYVVLSEGDGWLVVCRAAYSGADTMPPKDKTKKLAAILDGSPVCVTEMRERKLIAQPDGTHLAYACDVPRAAATGRGSVSLDALPAILPRGVLHPADAAWIVKRAIFLAAALSAAELKVDRDVADCLLVAPDTHMLVMLSPWGATEGTGSVAEQRTFIAGATKPILAMMDDDAKSRRIKAFVRGIEVDRVTESVALLREFDDMLVDLFGGFVFHEMETI